MDLLSLRIRGVAVCAALILMVIPSWFAPRAFAQAGGYADKFDLTGPVDHPRQLTLADLQGYPTWTMTSAFGAAQRFEVGRFTGVPLWDLLQDAGIQTTTPRNNDKLRKYVVATGSDGYAVVFSLAELDPEFGAEPVLIAFARDGQNLSQGEGMASVVTTQDKRGGRLVSNLVRLEVRDIDSPPGGM